MEKFMLASYQGIYRNKTPLWSIQHSNQCMDLREMLLDTTGIALILDTIMDTIFPTRFLRKRILKFYHHECQSVDKCKVEL